ncbi:hypothetical protein AB0L40_27425 [Patulibacter sp. NPDC049589]|uniref:hypothetical protein n=1 Tax=Patulibacter sp. NPDC049589 TaxID=3154731 RepID=UPI003426923F
MAFATGILIDAFLIRMALIPALMSVMDRRAWWIPRWLDRIVPNVDIEGTSLERGPKAVGPAEPVAGD